MGGQLSTQRAAANQYYNGEPFGNEVVGRSQVITRDVAETVDAIMPAMMKIFSSGGRTVEFVPSNEAGEQMAGQATDYCNWTWSVQNPGFSILYDWIKDGLLFKVGTIKIWWETDTEVSFENYEGLTDAQLQKLLSDDRVSLKTQTATPLDPMTMQQLQSSALHNVKVKVEKDKGRVKIMTVPPEELLLEDHAVTLEGSVFVGHQTKKTVSQAIEEGFDADLIRSLPSDTEINSSPERLARFKSEDQMSYRDNSSLDESTREIWITECYMLVDYDGDGIAEKRRIVVGGSTGNVILQNEEIDDHPFASWCPDPMPHKFYGNSIADKVMDLQALKSTVWRQMLDNLYLSNNPRTGVVDGQVNIDDLLTSTPGGIVRMKNRDALLPIETQFVAGQSYEMLEYVDKMRETRTGISRAMSAPDPAQLPSSATQVLVENDNRAERIELMARVFAETGLKPAFKRIMELLAKHQKEARQIRIDGQWQNVNPAEWDTEMDMTVNVGLGSNNKDRMVQQIQQLLTGMHGIVQVQGGLTGPLVTAENVYAACSELANAMGLPRPDKYFTNPQNAPPQQPQPHPAQQESQMKMQIMQQESQQKMQLQQSEQQSAQAMEQAKLQADQQRSILQLQHDKELAQIKLQHDMEIERMREGAERQRDAMRAHTDIGIDAVKAHQEMAIDQQKHEQDMELNQQQADLDAKLASKQADKDGPSV